MAAAQEMGEFAANPFGAGDAGAAAMGYLADSLGLSNTAQVQQGMAELDKLISEAASVGNKNRSLFGDYYGQMQSMYGDNASKYNDALQNYLDAVGQGPDQFSYGGSVNDFYDKFANQRQQAAMNAMRNMGGQNLFSSDFMNNMAAKQQALASEEAQKAYDKMMKDRQQQLQEWQAGQTVKQNYLGNLGNIVGMLNTDRSQLANAMDSYYGNMASQNNADLQTKADLTQAKTNLAMQEQSGAGAMLGAAGTVLGAMI